MAIVDRLAQRCRIHTEGTRLCISPGAGHANPTEVEVRSKGRGEMHHSTVSTFIDDVSRDAVRAGPLIIINRKWRIREVVSIIVTCNTEKRLLAWLMTIAWRYAFERFGISIASRRLPVWRYCNCERSFISSRFCEKYQQGNRWTYSKLAKTGILFFLRWIHARLKREKWDRT